MKYLITALPKSGTAFITNLLCSGGVGCGHELAYGQENIGFKGLSAKGMKIVAECSWMAAPHLNDHPEAMKIHLLRHPLRVVEALVKMRSLDVPINYRQGVIASHLPKIQYYFGLDKYIYWWIKWNELIEKGADKRFRIEDINKDKREFLKGIGIETENKLYDNEKCNTIGIKPKITTKMIINQELKADFIKTAKRYGYENLTD